jgi:hypothetical protein
MSGQKSIRRALARVWALLPEDWRGRAGDRFRRTTSAMGEYARENIRVRERLDDAPDLVWKAVEGAATHKHSEAVRNYAQEESERIRAEFERRTFEERVRKEAADARKAEAEARMTEVREIEARVELADKLRRIGAVPLWRADGSMAVVKAPPNFDWDTALSDKLLGSSTDPPVSDDKKAPKRPPNPETVLSEAVGVAEGFGSAAAASPGERVEDVRRLDAETSHVRWQTEIPPGDPND